MQSALSAEADGRFSKKVISLFSLIMVGAACAVLAILMAGIPLRKLILVFGGVFFLLAAAFYQQLKGALLFGCMVSLTYVRSYYSFDGILGYTGPRGLYWTPTDIILLVLLVGWVYEISFQRSKFTPFGRDLAAWFYPFAAACALSSLSAEHKDWVAFELIRILKFAFILIYVRYNIGRKEMVWVIAGIGAAVLLQSSIGVYQVLMKKVEFLAGETWYRAQGTMGHPNIFAPYLLLTVPLFLCLGATEKNRLFRTLYWGVSAAGLIGIALALSRLPWMLALMEVLFIMFGLVLLRYMPVKRVLGLFFTGGALILLLSGPFYSKILERFTENFSDSVDIRTFLNKSAIEMAGKSPLTGIGMGNSQAHLARIPELADQKVKAEESGNFHFAIMIHNLYFYLLAETGIVGIIFFAIFIVGVYISGFRSLKAARGTWRFLCLGMIVGMLTVMLQMVGDFSMWIDPVFYTFAFIAGLLNNIALVSTEHAEDWARDRRMSTAPTGAYPA